jgi:hypothetical protein
MFRRSLFSQYVRLDVEIRFRDVMIFALYNPVIFDFGSREVFNHGLSLHIFVLATKRINSTSKLMICRNQRMYVASRSSNSLVKLHL